MDTCSIREIHTHLFGEYVSGSRRSVIPTREHIQPKHVIELRERGVIEDDHVLNDSGTTVQDVIDGGLRVNEQLHESEVTFGGGIETVEPRTDNLVSFDNDDVDVRLSENDRTEIETTVVIGSISVHTIPGEKNTVTEDTEDLIEAEIDEPQAQLHTRNILPRDRNLYTWERD